MVYIKYTHTFVKTCKMKKKMKKVQVIVVKLEWWDPSGIFIIHPSVLLYY